MMVSDSKTSHGTLPSTASAAAPSPDTHPEESPSEPVLIVADPATLASLEESGFDAGTMVTGSRAATTKELAQQAAYRTLIDALAGDLNQDRASDKSLGVGMRYAHRQLDARWLASKRTRFSLIAVVNRLDRHYFSPTHCGEVRFVYRLGYRVETKTGIVESRLPLAMNVVFFVEPDERGSCTHAARSWMRSTSNTGGETAWLTGSTGPLSRARVDALRPKSVEFNFQSVRWPSTVRPSMAGHAEYVLRVFRRLPAEPFFEPMPLENTLDVERLRADKELRDALVAWIKEPENLRAIDDGVAVVPEAFLAKRAVSVSPHGLARRGNRPFRSVLEPRMFADVDVSRTQTIRSPAALLRRLDTMSCPGCHQSRSIAGFHLLGVEPHDDRTDAVEVPMSVHFHADLAYRRVFVEAMAEDGTLEKHRLLAERAPGDDAQGAHCGLGDPGFAAWTCAPGLRCLRGADEEIGECVAGEAEIGDPCEVGVVTASSNARRDGMHLEPPTSCGHLAVCEANSVGFPGGMCSGSCDSLPPGAACGGIPLLTDFNACLAAGTRFERCLADNTRPAALRACSFKSPCRDDYVCARTAEGGVCMPPYFLFQLRVDGHPN